MKRTAIPLVVALFLGFAIPPVAVAAASPTCSGKAATIMGTVGGDRLTGTPHRDVIVSLAGHDTVAGRGGNDLICSGRGRDQVTAGAGSDQVRGGPDKDHVSGDLGDDRILGGDGDDRLTGGAGADGLTGGPGWDHVDGEGGENQIAGGRGADTCANPTPLEGALRCETLVSFSTADSRFDAGVNNQGSWPNRQRAIDSSDNYVVELDIPNNIDVRNFFTFDLSNLQGDVVASRLVVKRGAGCGDPTYGLFDVTTDATTLNNNVGRNPDVFRDLGTGTSYGRFEPRPLACLEGGGSGPYRLDLNDAALTDIAASAGGFFSLGGAILRPSSGFLFGDSGARNTLVVGLRA